uniref:Endoplasmic reticulum lectin 1 n=1 Tax=Trichobilharzia regenti TaxID=157069 RepID=A0AA85KDK2_TRIRE|nr:unnamed protein product [Trichobilharzia regenti]
MREFNIFLHILFLPYFSYVNAFYNVTDDIIFDLKWSGSPIKSREESDAVEIRTTVGEDYECVIPTLLLKTNENGRKSSDLVDEETILQPLFTEQPCSIRSESYWSYELCHNQHIRQFHEERKLKKSFSVQEFYLGHYDPSPKIEKGAHKQDYDAPKTVTLGENSYPYYEVNYIDGTLCDLIQQHRSTTVMYICHESIGGQIVDISEIRTCQYQVVFATKLLCSHPMYKQKRAHTNAISCHSKNGSPSKPMALLALEAERRKLQSQTFSNLAALLSDAFKSKIKVTAKREKDVVLYQVQSTEDLKTDYTPSKDINSGSSEEDNRWSTAAPTAKSSAPDQPTTIKTASDNQVKEFLHGKLCLSGKLGWWTHEICFNKHVRQYHEDENELNNREIRLGNWDLHTHVKWMKGKSSTEKQISSIPSDRQISLYYGNGDLCQETGKLRETVVKLKCLPSTNSGISLAFSEPKTCVYSILVESSMFCDIIPLADENGIIPLEKV